MEVVLNQDIKNLGYKGDIVDIKRGYFRFLSAKGVVDLATEKRKKLAEIRNQKRVMHKEELMKNAQEVADKLKGLSLEMTEKASEKGKLYGSITEENIIEAIKEKAKIELDKENIKMDHIKEAGDHKVTIHLSTDVEVEIEVKISPEE